MSCFSNRLCNILLYMVGLLSSPALAQDRFFNDGIMDKYIASCELNDAHNYLKAYGSFKELEMLMNRTLKGFGKTSADLTEDEFRFPYWPAKKSLAEVAYMLGQHTDMTRIIAELKGVLNTRQFSNYQVRDAFMAELHKLDGDVHFLTGLYSQCEKSLLSALIGNEDLDFEYAVRGDLAQLYYKVERYEEAIVQLDSILGGKRFGNDARVRGYDSDMQEILSQKAISLARLGRFDEAIAMAESVLGWYMVRKDQRQIIEALRKTAKIYTIRYEKTGQYIPKSLTYYRDYLKRSKQYIDECFVNMNESERERYWMAEQPFVTDCYRLGDKDAGLLYDVALFSKAILQQLGNAFDSLQSVNEKRQRLSAIRTDWRKVKSALPLSSVAIEFIAYEKGGMGHLGAVVLGKSSLAPVFVEIGSLDSFLSEKISEGITVRDAVTSTNREYKDLLYTSSSLADKIWNESLLKAIGNAKTIYFAADGILHLLAIEYILPKRLDNCSVYRLSSTRMLLDKKAKVRSDKLLACGGIDYLTAKDAKEEYGNDAIAYNEMSAMSPGLPYLAGSLAEVDSIVAIRGNNPNDTILRDVSATESTLRQLLGKYHIVHIATHGHFPEAESQGTDLLPLVSDQQLSMSCLYLSGAERNLNNSTFNPASLDGILSARELASLDLSDIDLFVLSACQSGLGYVTPDGVSGLQRGLKMGGARAVVVSLWEVDDHATGIMMHEFMSNLNKGMSLHNAFHKARAALKDSVVETRRRRSQLHDISTLMKYDQPRYYDAFILIDGI